MADLVYLETTVISALFDKIAEINRRLGLMVPIIVTPAMLFCEDER